SGTDALSALRCLPLRVPYLAPRPPGRQRAFVPRLEHASAREGGERDVGRKAQNVKRKTQISVRCIACTAYYVPRIVSLRFTFYILRSTSGLQPATSADIASATMYRELR